MKTGFLLLGLLLITTTTFGQTINPNFIDGQIYVKLKTASPNKVSSIASVDITAELPFLAKYTRLFSFIEAKKTFYTEGSQELQKIYRLTLKKNEAIETAIEMLKNDDAVAYVEKVPLRKCINTPNDSEVASQWSMTKIHAFDAWNINSGSADIIVAVVDNAIQSNHVDLQANMLTGRDVADNDSDTNPPNDLFAHGTHVSGIVGAVSNNSIGIASAGNNHVKVLPVKTTPDGGNYRSIYYGYEGITWAADNGAKIISCSWGGGGYSQAEKDVIDYAFSKGCIVVAAAGNENTSDESFPAAYDHVISVASTDSDDARSSFSNYGTWVDIAAPGRGILSTVPFNTYASYNGTSMATPLVSCVLGYIWSCFPSLTPAQVENILKNTADNIDAQNTTYIGKLGAGRINLLKAIACPAGGLTSATITATNATYICNGETTTLTTATAGTGLTYSWLKDGVALTNNAASLTASEAGNYQLMITQGSCSLLSNIVKVTINQQITPSPTVTSRTVTACNGTLIAGNGLQATAITCAYGGPATFTYAGSTVGYDGYESSAADPTALVSNLGGTVNNVSVSITWQKIDGGTQGACGTPDGGGKPYNEEVSFQLKSPSGTIITLLGSGTYASGSATSGMITTTFQDGAATIVNNSLPSAGTFAPNQPLSTFVNETPIGTWTLLPQDNGLIDPLCVQSFSVTIATNSPNQASQITWWNTSSAGNQLATGTEYLPTIANTTGTQTYYARAQCVGLCPSLRVPATVTVSEVFKTSQQPENQDLCVGQNAYFSVTSTCSNVTYLWQENRGNGWNNLTNNATYGGVSTANLIINSVTIHLNNYQYRCTIKNNLTNEIIISNTGILTTKFSADSITIFYESPIANRVELGQAVLYIFATNKIGSNATVDYRAGNAITLNPGFEVKAGNVFRAKIERPCTNVTTFTIPENLKK